MTDICIPNCQSNYREMLINLNAGPLRLDKYAMFSFAMTIGIEQVFLIS